MRRNSVIEADGKRVNNSIPPASWTPIPACAALMVSMLLLIGDKTPETVSRTNTQRDNANRNAAFSLKETTSKKSTEYRILDVKRLDYSEWGGPDMIAAIEKTAKSSQPVVIDLTWSPIDKEALQILSGVDNLKGLFLFGTNITDEDVQSLRNLTKLDLLDIGTTNLSIEGILEFSKSRHLKILYMSSLSSPLRDKDISRIVETWPELENLSLTNANLTDTGLAEITKLKSLKKLSLRGTKITDRGMKALAGLKNLKTLHVDHCDIGDKGVQHLEKLKRLEKLNLNYTEVTNAGLTYVANLPKLKRIYLVGTNVDDQAISILKKQKGLEFIGGDFSEAGEAELKAALPLYRANRGG